MIDIAVIRYLATDPSESLGSLFENGGGPGAQVDQLPAIYEQFPAYVEFHINGSEGAPARQRVGATRLDCCPRVPAIGGWLGRG